MVTNKTHAERREFEVNASNRSMRGSAAGSDTVVFANLTVPGANPDVGYLLFPWVDEIEYSVSFSGDAAAAKPGFVAHEAIVVQSDVGGTVVMSVVVRFAEPVANATISLTVSQGGLWL